MTDDVVPPGARPAAELPTAEPPRVSLIGKPGCHLCDVAREVVASVATELGVGWQEVSILDDPELYDRYWDAIPVVLVDGEAHDYWRVDERRLRKALAGGKGAHGGKGAPGGRRLWRRGPGGR